MDLVKLNKLVEKACVINSHINSIGKDPLLEESLFDCISAIKIQYSSFLTDKLFDFYEDYFEDNEMEGLESYLISEVSVFGDELEQEMLLLGIKPSPLRIEVHDAENNYHNVLWSAA